MGWFRNAAPHRGQSVLATLPAGCGAVRLDGEARPRISRVRLSAETPRHAEDWRRLAQAAGLGDARLTALLDPGAYQTLVVEAPSVPEEELRGALHWKVRDLINFHSDDAVLDYLPIPASEGRVPSLYVVAAQAQAVRALAQPLQEAELALDAIDIRETAQHHIAQLLMPEGYAIGILHFDGQHSLLTFSFGPALAYSRRTDGRGAVGAALYERVAMEAQRSVDYFERQFSWLPLSRIYLAPMANQDELRQRLEGYLPVAVEALDLDALFELTPEAAAALNEPHARNQAFHLIGAGLRT